MYKSALMTAMWENMQPAIGKWLEMAENFDPEFITEKKGF